MLSKSAARRFFVVGTALSFGAFALLTLDTLSRIPAQTNQAAMSESVVRGKHLWDRSNCMGCHTILGEGAYYAPELTQVYSRRGPAFIAAMLRDPESMYPGRRRMQKYGFDEAQIADLVAFLQWIGGMDLNGFPPKPDLLQTATPSGQVAEASDRPLVFNQMCIACHALGGQGGLVGPALDGVGDRLDAATIRMRLVDPKSVKPDALMPKLPLSDADIAELVAFLSKLQAKGSSK
ncbi:MAG: c-type cytochrome [Planctomycetes bacterium]|nr:c-type cytochrome [Planctomycetota bacterium]